MGMNRDSREYLTHPKHLIAILCITVLILFLVPFSISSNMLPPPETLLLTTTILADTTFEILEPSPVRVQVGVAKEIGYKLTANSRMELTITGLHSTVGGDFRMLHNTLDNMYLPYTVSFDYSGTGNRVPVISGAKNLMGDINGDYNIQSTFSIFVPMNETVMEGGYSDTIKFLFTNPL